MKALYFTTHEAGEWIRIPDRFRQTEICLKNIDKGEPITIFVGILDQEITHPRYKLIHPETEEEINFCSMVFDNNTCYTIGNKGELIKKNLENDAYKYYEKVTA